MDRKEAMTVAAIMGAEAAEKPEKADYIRRIQEMSREDLAFMDGYLFAKVTEAGKRRA